MRPRGFSLRVFIPSGDPDGLRIVEKSLWTGQVIEYPRTPTALAEAQRRDALHRAGVYLLVGLDEESDQRRLYIGEGESVMSRLRSHNRDDSKEFWTKTAIFTTKDESLNKAHIKFLEARLYELATKARRCKIDNRVPPSKPTLSEIEETDVEAILADLLLCLSTTGWTEFEATCATGSELDGKVYQLSYDGVDARGIVQAGDFLVLEGSTANKTARPGLKERKVALRNKLLEEGTFREVDGQYVLTRDHLFNSPTLAVHVLTGRQGKGRAEWKDQRGRSLSDIGGEDTVPE